MRIGLQTLIIFWWVGACAAGIALLLPVYNNYVILGTIGWIIVGISTGLIIYEIRMIKKNDRGREFEEQGNRDD